MAKGYQDFLIDSYPFLIVLDDRTRFSVFQIILCYTNYCCHHTVESRRSKSECMHETLCHLALSDLTTAADNDNDNDEEQVSP